ncbi:MAG: hypothetical protein JSW06_05695 [Thermoplasmatales archaeon]|nr:MAG: hypothetical protein JSW06_05695 [Thermoplasmatales archaeon]
MAETGEKIWKKFLRNHWKLCVLFIVVAALAIIGAIYVFLWFVGDAQLTGLVPVSLGSWSMGYLVTFLLHLLFWGVLFVGIPVLIAIVLIYSLGWKKIPDEEKKEYKRGNLFGKRNRRSEGGEGLSFLIFIVFCIKVYLDGNWGAPFATWKFDYLVYSWLWALIWVLVIFGIPILIGGTWWLRHEMKKEP